MSETLGYKSFVGPDGWVERIWVDVPKDLRQDSKLIYWSFYHCQGVGYFYAPYIPLDLEDSDIV